MGRRGPAPTPKALLKIAGTNRKRNERDGPGKAVEIPADVPARPTYLSGAAKTEWARVIDVLGKVDGLLTRADQATVGAYCQAVADHAYLCRRVAKQGMTITDASGKKYKNPEAILMMEVRTAVLRLSQELGITPASRSRVRVPETSKGEPSEFEVDVG